MNTEERYISLLTDFGFKRIFGTKPNKPFKEAKRAVAVKFLALGVPVNTIVQATGLTAEKIQLLT